MESPPQQPQQPQHKEESLDDFLNDKLAGLMKEAQEKGFGDPKFTMKAMSNLLKGKGKRKRSFVKGNGKAKRKAIDITSEQLQNILDKFAEDTTDEEEMEGIGVDAFWEKLRELIGEHKLFQDRMQDDTVLDSDAIKTFSKKKGAHKELRALFKIAFEQTAPESIKPKRRKVYSCKRCGEQGHNSKGCKKQIEGDQEEVNDNIN